LDAFFSLKLRFRSYAVQSGLPTKVVSDRLGPSSIEITADLYTHVFAEGQSAAAEAIDTLLSPALRTAEA
jgi:hypothetical protein